MGNKSSKMSAYPPEYTKQIQQLENFCYWTLEIANQLEKMNQNMPKMKRPETDKQQKELMRPNNPLRRMYKTFDMYSGIFVGTNYGESMDAFGSTFSKLDKHLVYSQLRLFEEVILPLKTWTLEDYPALLKELEKCQKLKKSMDRAQKENKSRPKDKNLQQKAQLAKEVYDQLAGQCKKEMDKLKKMGWHHTMLLKMVMEIQMIHSQQVALKISKTLEAVMLMESDPATTHTATVEECK